MKTRKVFLVICIFTIIQLFISAAFAGKPENPPGKDRPKPRTNSVKYGYAMLEDGNGNVITSDGLGQYVDIENERPEFYDDFGDKTRVRSYDDNGELVWLRAFLGKAEMPYRSPRRVMFGFDLYKDATSRLGEGLAVYDMLYKLANGSRRGNPVGDEYHLLLDQLDVVASDEDQDGKDDTWVITPLDGPVTIQVYQNFGKKHDHYRPLSR